ncbi:MAG: prepilin-type N-terminal cleavage/methylation domain-containing protein [Thermodesulfobacteriota bacterium]
MQIGAHKRNSGTTLVELLVYILLLSISAGALYSILISNMKTYDSIENRMVMHQDLRNALALISREVRMAGLNPDGVAGVGFQQDPSDNFDTDANSLHFTMDLNGDGVISGTGEDVGYFLQYDTTTHANNLMRRADYGSGLAAEVLLENVTRWEITYLAQDETTPVTDPSAINPTLANTAYFVNILIEAETSKEDVVSGTTKKQVLVDRMRVRNAGL